MVTGNRGCGTATPEPGIHRPQAEETICSSDSVHFLPSGKRGRSKLSHAAAAVMASTKADFRGLRLEGALSAISCKPQESPKSSRSQEALGGRLRLSAVPGAWSPRDARPGGGAALGGVLPPLELGSGAARDNPQPASPAPASPGIEAGAGTPPGAAGIGGLPGVRRSAAGKGS